MLDSRLIGRSNHRCTPLIGEDSSCVDVGQPGQPPGRARVRPARRSAARAPQARPRPTAWHVAARQRDLNPIRSVDSRSVGSRSRSGQSTCLTRQTSAAKPRHRFRPAARGHSSDIRLGRGQEAVDKNLSSSRQTRALERFAQGADQHHAPKPFDRRRRLPGRLPATRPTLGSAAPFGAGPFGPIRASRTSARAMPMSLSGRKILESP